MGSLEQFKGSDAVIDQTMEETGGNQPRVQWKQMGHSEKTAAVHEEIKRMNGLPATSTYATHRLRVLNKILQLLAIQNYFSRPRVGVAFCRAVYMNWLVYTKYLMELLNIRALEHTPRQGNFCADLLARGTDYGR